MLIEKVIGKKGIETFKLNNKLIYSFYDPYKEAENYLLTLPLNDIVITFCGADYINSSLVKSKKVNKVYSFEPITFPNQIKSNKIIRFHTILELISLIKTEKIKSEFTSIVVWVPFIESNPIEYIQYLNDIKNELVKSTLSNLNIISSSSLEKKNIIRNLLKLNCIKYLQNETIANPPPALILSSGCSLQLNIELIKKIQSKCITFAYSSSLDFLNSNNIIPDYVIAVDPGYGTFYHLQKFKQICKIITTLSISPSIINLKNYDFIFFNYGSEIENELYKKTNILKSIPEGSVAFNLFDILKKLNFISIFLFGQDFAFFNNKSHINGGNFETEFLTKNNYFNSFESNIYNYESSSIRTFITDNHKKLNSNIPMSIYYNHFLSKCNEYPIKLTGKIFNSYNNAVEFIDECIFNDLNSINKNDIIIKMGILNR